MCYTNSYIYDTYMSKNLIYKLTIIYIALKWVIQFKHKLLELDANFLLIFSQHGQIHIVDACKKVKTHYLLILYCFQLLYINMCIIYISVFRRYYNRYNETILVIQ